MNFKNKIYAGMTAAAVAAAAGALAIGLSGPASASSVPPFQVEICSWGNYQTDAVFSGGGVLNVAPGGCATETYQNISGGGADIYDSVTLYVHDVKEIGSFSVDVTQGAGIATLGTADSPSSTTF